MTREEYLESQRGKPYTQIVLEQPKEIKIGSIRGDNLRNVVAILAGGLQYRLDNAAESPLRTALLTAFRYMTLPDYAINLSLAENIEMLNTAVSMGLVTTQEQQTFINLASYTENKFNLDVMDCVDYFGTTDDFITLSNVPAPVSGLILKLNNTLIEEDYIRIEYSANVKGYYGSWVLAGQVTVKDAGVYVVKCGVIPAGAKLRAFSSMYSIEGTLEV